MTGVNLDANTESVSAAIDTGLLAGAVTLVWQDGAVRQVNTLGHRDVEAKLPMERDTVFRIASMSKPITVAAAMTLVDEGRLALTDPIANWIPELANPRVMTSIDGPLDRSVPARRPITVEDLMTHRGGLAYGFTVPPPLGKAYNKLQSLQDPDRWLAELGSYRWLISPVTRSPTASRPTYWASCWRASRASRCQMCWRNASSSH